MHAVRTMAGLSRGWILALALGGLAGSLLSGCAAETGGSRGGPNARRGGDAGPGELGGEGDCESNDDCVAPNVCFPIEGVLRCVDPSVTRADSGTPGPSSCGPCPAPGECRGGLCIQPNAAGDVCEFDPECADTELCISGRCTTHPCPSGRCACAAAADCPVGLICEAGTCIGGPGVEGCIADRDCPSGHACEAGRCLPPAACMITNPDLSGRWSMDSELRLREALPGFVDGLLGAAGDLFDFLSGSGSFGLPGWAASALRSALRGFIPDWVTQIISFLSDLDDILSTWRIEELMDLVSARELDRYTGTHTWTAVEFMYRGRVFRGDPATIIDWRFGPNTFTATATCGIFVIQRHDVDVSIGGIIKWLLDTAVNAATDGRFRTLQEALDEASYGFCTMIGDATYSATNNATLTTLAETACRAELSSLVDVLERAIAMARLSGDFITLKGSAPIVSPRLIEPGVWEGTMAGGDFSGDFNAFR